MRHRIQDKVDRDVSFPCSKSSHVRDVGNPPLSLRKSFLQGENPGTNRRTKEEGSMDKANEKTYRKAIPFIKGICKPSS